MTEFDRILDDAFSRLEAGEPIEAVLNRYPQQAEALRPLLETVSLSLHAYTYTEPASRVGMARGRQRFLSEAARRAEKRRARRRNTLSLAWLWPARRWAVTAAALLVLFLAAGTTAVVASADSLPGSPLYPVKIAAEEVRLTLTRAPEPRARLHIERAQRRNQELNTLLAREVPVGGDLLTSGLSEAKAALRELSRVPAEQRSEPLETYAMFATSQAEALDQMRDRMTPAQQPLLETTADQYRRLADLARSAQTNPDALVPPPTAVPWPTLTPTPTPTPSSTRPRPTAKATRRAGPAAVATRRPPARPTATPTRRAHPTRATPTPTPTRRRRPQTPVLAVTPAATGPAVATLNIRPTRTGTPRPSIRPPTPTLSSTAVRRPTRTATRTPRPVVTVVTTPRPIRPTPTPTATRRKPRPTPTPTRRRRSPTPTPTRYRPTPTPTRHRPTPTPTRHNTRPTPTRRPEPTPTPPAVATAIPTAALPVLPTPTPTPPSTVATAAPTAALPALPTSTGQSHLNAERVIRSN